MQRELRSYARHANCELLAGYSPQCRACKLTAIFRVLASSHQNANRTSRRPMKELSQAQPSDVTSSLGQGRVAVSAASRPALFISPCRRKARFPALLNRLFMRIMMVGAQTLKWPRPKSNRVTPVWFYVVAYRSWLWPGEAHAAEGFLA